MKKYLSISEFSRISGISRKALIFYDNSGLFSPALRGENGYRYYTHEQIYTISVIDFQSELGMSHNEIKRYMQNITIHNAKSMLERQEEVISKEIARLKATQNMIAERKASLDEGMRSSSGITISCWPEIPLFRTSIDDKERWAVSDENWIEHITRLQSVSPVYCYQEGYIIKKENLLRREFNMVNGIIQFVGKSESANTSIPEGEYLTAYAGGNLENDLSDIYEKMVIYASENNLEIIGDAYEKRLIDETCSREQSEHRIRILIPVKRI